MTTIADYFEQAQLSRAAYALDLQRDMFGASDTDYTSALKTAGMSKKQAEEFANKYRVIAQSPDTGPFGNGFSATVFKNDSNGEITIAIRGTEDGVFSGAADWATNIGDIGADGIAVAQGIAMLNWLQRLLGAQGATVTQYDYHPDLIDPQTGIVLIPAHLTTSTAEATGELSAQPHAKDANRNESSA